LRWRKVNRIFDTQDRLLKNLQKKEKNSTKQLDSAYEKLTKYEKKMKELHEFNQVLQIRNEHLLNSSRAAELPLQQKDKINNKDIKDISEFMLHNFTHKF